MATSITRMGSAAALLTVAMCCSAPDASAQLFLDVGSGNRNLSPTANIGTGGPGSATAIQGLNEPVGGANREVALPWLNQPGDKSLGVTGNAAGTLQGSLSSGGRSSPADSVTNTLMGPVSTLAPHATNSAATPAPKRKHTSTAGAGTVAQPR